MATLSDIAARMLVRGIDVPTVADVLDVEIEDLYALRNTLHVDIDQNDAVGALNRLAWRAYEKGIEMLETGTPAAKMQLIRMMISIMRGLLGSKSPKEMQELTSEFRELIELSDTQGDDSTPDSPIQLITEDTPDAPPLSHTPY